MFTLAVRLGIFAASISEATLATVLFGLAAIVIVTGVEIAEVPICDTETVNASPVVNVPAPSEVITVGPVV